MRRLTAKQWAFEGKWDGYRLLFDADHGAVTLRSRSGRDMTADYPGLQSVAADLADHRVVLDGEVVALDRQIDLGHAQLVVLVPSLAPEALLDEVGLSEFLDVFPHELSGGMQQRVALVRALALYAPLLVMDEPFAALDEITRAEMRQILDNGGSDVKPKGGVNRVR